MAAADLREGALTEARIRRRRRLLAAAIAVPLLCVAVVTAGLTAFYMTRQMWYVFFGQPRVVGGRDSESTHQHSSTPALQYSSTPIHHRVT